MHEAFNREKHLEFAGFVWGFFRNNVYRDQAGEFRERVGDIASANL
jgi:hypothetical protein